MASIDVAVPVRASLGEGPAWDAPRNRLLWVDILESRVHISDLASGATQTRQFAEPVGAIVPTTTGELLLTTPAGVELLTELDGSPTLLADIESELPSNRMNDGKCDPSGRLWTGTMHSDAEPGRGSLYVVDGELDVRAVLSGVSISNGLAFEPDESAMYFVDTPLQRIDRLVVRDGVLISREVRADLSGWPGRPDGMTIDDTGCLWVAMFDGGCLLRVTPSGGIEQLDLPVSWPSSIAFAGADLDVMMVTTGRKPGEPADSPGGCVLAVDAGVSGAPTYPFDLRTEPPEPVDTAAGRRS